MVRLFRITSLFADTLTSSIPNCGAPDGRASVDPLPSIVMLDATVGNARGPSRDTGYGSVKRNVVSGGRPMVSAPLPAAQPPLGASVLAAMIASASVQVMPSTVMVAANAGAWPI